MLTNTLLIVLVVLWVFIYRKQFTLFFMSAKKRHFIEKLENVTKSIWDKEFQKFQALEMREAIRLDMDRQNEAVDAFKVELARPDHKPETLAVLTAKMTEAQNNANRFKAQIQMLDNEIAGQPFNPGNAGDSEKGIAPADPTPGTQGLNDVLASMNEVGKMFKAFIKTL